MSRARQVANFDPALLAADEVSGDKVHGGTISGSPVLVTPNIGTPNAGVATNLTGIPAANVTGVLPSAVTGGSGLDASNIGITHCSKWLMDTAHTSTSDLYFFTSWTKATTQSAGSLGADMTHSSGVFTFPATGIWTIHYQVFGHDGGGNEERYIGAGIHTTTNNSTYVESTKCGTQTSNIGTYNYWGTNVNHIWDVTDVSNYKVKFRTYQYGSGIVINDNYTFAEFIRLGDT